MNNEEKEEVAKLVRGGVEPSHTASNGGRRVPASEVEGCQYGQVASE